MSLTRPNNKVALRVRGNSLPRCVPMQPARHRKHFGHAHHSYEAPYAPQAPLAPCCSAADVDVARQHAVALQALIVRARHLSQAASCLRL